MATKKTVPSTPKGGSKSTFPAGMCKGGKAGK
jgi:hypothetical protein